MTDQPKTVAELQAEMQALRLQMDAAQLAPLQAIVAALAAPDVANALQVLQANIESLTENRRQQAQNLITVLTNSPAFLAGEAEAIDLRLNPPAEPEPEELAV